MEKRVENKNVEKKTFAIKIFAGLFFGFLLSIMATMMYIGDSINVWDFLDAGNVYDFSQQILKQPSKGWIYDEVSQEYCLQNDHALKKYMLDGKERAWGYLYLNISKMSLPEMEGRLNYYNKGNQKVLEQPIFLHEGENIILLQETTAMYRMGIRILDAKGQSFSIQSMQIREKASGYTSKRFGKIFGTAFAGFLVVFCLFLTFGEKFALKIKIKQRIEGFYTSFVEILQYIYQVFFEKAGEKIAGGLGKKEKNAMRVFLFGLLLFWMVTGNALSWSANKEYYRFHAAVCLVLLIAIGMFSWEKLPKQIAWKSPLAISWICLWSGIAISDFFVKKDIGMIGFFMLFGGGYFLLAWENMEKKEEMIYNMLDALEKTFWAAVAYCMLFRAKYPGIHYNGIFPNPEEFAMYAVLMLSVFLLRMDGDIRKSATEKIFFRKYVMNISGGAAAFYFILRSGNFMGVITVFLIIGLFAIRQIFLLQMPFKKLCRVLSYLLKGSIIAFLLVCVVHVSTKNLPIFLEMDVIYESEMLTTGLDDEMKEALNELYPGSMDGVKQDENNERNIVQRNYIRRLNLFGNKNNKLKVFRSYAVPDNGYIYTAYKYGLFLLLPYVIFQICFLGKGISIFIRKKEKGKEIDADFWLLMIGILFTGFSIYGNLEISVFGQPLWICYYLSAGYWFTQRKKV